MQTPRSYYKDKPFPFERVQPNSLIPGEKYVIQLLESKDHAKEPFTKLKGRFVRLEQHAQTYVVFENVFILKKTYKGYPSFLEKNDTLTTGGPQLKLIKKQKNNAEKPVNGGREVYLRSNNWEFGIPNEENFLSNYIFTKLNPQLPEYMQLEVKSFYRHLGGRKSRTRRHKRSKKSKTKRRR
jgi:hypothetical protein